MMDSIFQSTVENIERHGINAWNVIQWQEISPYSVVYSAMSIAIRQILLISIVENRIILIRISVVLHAILLEMRTN